MKKLTKRKLDPMPDSELHDRLSLIEGELGRCTEERTRQIAAIELASREHRAYDVYVLCKQRERDDKHMNDVSMKIAQLQWEVECRANELPRIEQPKQKRTLFPWSWLS